MDLNFALLDKCLENTPSLNLRKGQPADYPKLDITASAIPPPPPGIVQPPPGIVQQPLGIVQLPQPPHVPPLPQRNAPTPP